MATLGLRLYRRALATSRDFQTYWLDEAVDALEMAMASERRKHGVIAAAWLWIRAMADAVRPRGGDASGGSWLSGWSQDLCRAVRSLRRSPQYAGTVIVTLALAIGGVTAVFRLADPMLFRRLPFPHAERLYVVSVSGGRTFGFNQYPDYFRAERAGVFERMGTFYGPVIANLPEANDGAESVLGYAVTSGFLEMLGSPIQRGRAFAAEDYEHSAPEHGDLAAGTPVLITDGLWTLQFGRTSPRSTVCAAPM